MTTTTPGGRETRPPGRGRPDSRAGSAQERLSNRQRRRLERQQAETRSRQLKLLGIVAGVAIVLAAGLALLTNLSASGGLSGVKVEPVDYPVDGMTKGNPNAPLTITDWGDFT